MAREAGSAQSERPRSCPVEDLRPGDVIEVYVCIENDDYDWVRRTVLSNEDGRLKLRCPEGWEHGAEYSVPIRDGERYRLAYVDQPLVWEGEGA
jgi:hypothetical protein